MKDCDLQQFQREIDDIVPAEWKRYLQSGMALGEAEGALVRKRLPALQRYEEAFDKVLAEIKQTEVSVRPARR